MTRFCPKYSFFRRATHQRMMSVLVGSVLLIFGGIARADMREAEAEMKFLLGARELSATYVPSLNLKGKTMLEAEHVLIAEGFRCGVEADGPYKSRPIVSCDMEHAKLNDQCSSVTVDIDPDWQPATRPELVKKMSVDVVKHALAFCPFYDPIRKEVYEKYADNHVVAEREFTTAFNGAGLVGVTLAEGFNSLLEKGYYCGFEDKLDDSLHRTPVAMCIKERSNIKYCYQAKVTFEVKWAHLVGGKPAEFVAQMEHVKVNSIKTSCVLPPYSGATT